MSTNNDSNSTSSARKAAVKILLAVLKEGNSLSALNGLSENLDSRDAGFARMLSFGVLRFYFQLQAMLKPLMKKKLKEKDLDVQLVLLIGLYQIVHTRVPDYAVVDAAVKQMRKSKKQWAANMVNAVLRNFIRQHEVSSEIEYQTEEAEFSHPQWIIDRLKKDWPDCWQAILSANNEQAPMTLRINQQKVSTAEYKQQLETDFDLSCEGIKQIPAALVLSEARDVVQMPGFDEGWVSVQDAGAQLAAQILKAEVNDNILDACAAPGGKTAHLFELQPEIQLTALDISEKRLARVEENCLRLGFSPRLVVADAIQVEEWWQGELFDKILLDVPCSASGVIRRHPDIKHLRREDDIETLVQVQRDILTKNWALLKPGGRLLYATCSLFKVENEEQVEWFLQGNKDAQLIELDETILQLQETQACGSASVGIQLFPMAFRNDGFYYALIEKKRPS